jgi:hypothetical protein
MPDPGFDARVDAALKETRRMLGFLSRFGLLRNGIDDDPDAYLRSKARIELTIDSLDGIRRLPDDVRSYLSWLVSKEATRPKRKRQGRPVNTIRDFWIVNMIAHLAAEHRIKPTRDRKDRDKRPQCGCSIVAKVLGELRINIDETGVETVWADLADQAQPDRLPLPIGLSETERARIDQRLAQLLPETELAQLRLRLREK